MKLKFDKTQVFISDEDNGDKWVVEFTGKHRDIDARVYRNGRYEATCSPRGGHANKTAAIMIIKKVVEV